MDWIDGSAEPGWHDVAGLLLTFVGFGIAIWQIYAAKKETRKATKALGEAQRQLSTRALMVLIPHFRSVSEDLSFAQGANEIEVARRALVRFGHLAEETNAVLGGAGEDHSDLMGRMTAVATKAKRAKGQLMRAESPDVNAVVKGAAAEIESLSTSMTGLSAKIYNTIEGASDA